MFQIGAADDHGDLLPSLILLFLLPLGHPVGCAMLWALQWQQAPTGESAVTKQQKVSHLSPGPLLL